MTASQDRDSRAWKCVVELQHAHATPEQTLELVQRFADDPAALHFTPHLVTALRETKLLPAA